MAKNKPNDETNKYCLELIEERIRELGEAKLVAREIGCRDGTLSKWRSGRQRLRGDSVDRILSLYGQIPMELLKLFPKEHLNVLLKAYQADPALITLMVEVLKRGDKRIIKHLESQIDLLINPSK